MFLKVAIQLREAWSLVQNLADKIDEKFIDKAADWTVKLQKQEPFDPRGAKDCQVQLTDEIVDVSVVSQGEVPAIHQVKKTAEDEPVMWRRQAMIQKVPKTVEVPQVQHVDEIIDESIVTQRGVHTIQTAQKTEEVPKVQFLDPVVDIPVSMQRQVQQEQKETGCPHPICEAGNYRRCAACST